LILQYLGLWEKAATTKDKLAAIGLLCGRTITTYGNIDTDYPFEAYI
jgi:hypothetical protein